MTSEESSVSPVRVGVAGLGRAFVLSRPAFIADPGVRLVAAAEPREVSRNAFVREFGGRSYETIDELCADPDIELIYVSTPHEFHYEHVCKATAAGKHVLVEKPLAISDEECQDLIETADASGKVLMVAYCMRYHPLIQEMKRLVDEKVYGEVIQYSIWTEQFTRYEPGHWALSAANLGGVLWFSRGASRVAVASRNTNPAAVMPMASATAAPSVPAK